MFDVAEIQEVGRALDLERDRFPLVDDFPEELLHLRHRLGEEQSEVELVGCEERGHSPWWHEASRSVARMRAMAPTLSTSWSGYSGLVPVTTTL